MAIKVEMLRCFATVARSGNLADAADRLGRTPSAISMMLKQLEDHLGAPLFEAGRKSKLTALGVFALDEASRELDHFDRAVLSIEHFARAKSGLVRIAVVPSVAETILPDIVRAFLADHPDVHIDVRDMDSAGVIREIGRERADLGIATGEGANTDIAREELFCDVFGIVCRNDHPLVRSHSPVTWSDLSPWPFLANGTCEQIPDQYLRSVTTASKMMIHNTTSLLALVRAGVGITALPQLVAERSDASISFLPVAGTQTKRRIDLLRRTHRRLSPAADAFETAIREAILHRRTSQAR
ncbi:MAG: LysR family transcriptional regulator [Alphaproteobacteria bacterium]|nr:LysR family transcriptional regulator [Alphaproteobacteria bacterium]